jgi:O-antigen/teichoic acid export membrane protein
MPGNVDRQRHGMNDPQPKNPNKDTLSTRSAAFNPGGRIARIFGIGRSITTFLVAQGIVQVIGFLSGFFLLRWMELKDYAAFTLVFGIQGLMLGFVDLGFSQSIVTLVGSRSNNPDVVGRYVAAARALRRRMMPWVIAGGGLLFLGMGLRQEIAPPTIAVLFALAVACLHASTTNNLYGWPLVIKQDMVFVHRVYIWIASLRFAAYALLHWLSALGAVTALALNGLLLWLQSYAVRQRATLIIREPAIASSEATAGRVEMLAYIRPQVPVMLFFYVQSQIIILLIAAFGSTKALAEVGALMRLNALIAVIPAFYGWFVQPYFARISVSDVASRLAVVLALAACALGAISAVGFLFPEPFVWLLGFRYEHLDAEVGVTLAGACAGAYGGLLYSVIMARKWIFWDTILWIAGLSLGMQGLLLAIVDVSTARGAMVVLLWGNVGIVTAYAVVCARGLARDRIDGESA